MTPQQALARLQGQCSRSEFCCAQIREKLSKWREKALAKGEPSFSEEEAESILSALLEEKYVDDARFASAYVRDKARFSKWGEVKISYNLKRLGIPHPVIRGALEENRELFGKEVLACLLEKKWGQMKAGDTLEVKRQKVLRFALGRGYGYREIMDILLSLPKCINK